MPKTVIADAGYGSEKNYLYALDEDNDADEERFEYLIPYGTYIKKQKENKNRHKECEKLDIYRRRRLF